MTAYDEENYHPCVYCGIAPCDCGEYVDTSWCKGCSCCEDDEEETPA